MTRIYVGNLSFNSTEDSVRDAFTQFGSVSKVSIITDRETGRPRGFGFVEMDDDSEAKSAIDGLNGKDLDGRSLNVNEARPRDNQGGGGGAGGFRGGRDRAARW